VNDVILAVKVNAEADAVFSDPTDANLTVSAFDSEKVENPMLVGGSCRCVLIAEVPFGNAELDIPPPGEGVGVPVSHDGCRIRSSEPPFSAVVCYHLLSPLLARNLHIRAYQYQTWRGIRLVSRTTNTTCNQSYFTPI
jgi:hypothetical protein